MKLTELVGNHVLSGVDIGSGVFPSEWGERYEHCQTVAFVLDGVTYCAIESPEDGYRSCMRELKNKFSEPVKNTFPGQPVIAKMREDKPDEDWGNEKNEVLELIDVKTGGVILAVGTGNTNDYYPYWVCEFNPENMGINQS